MKFEYTTEVAPGKAAIGDTVDLQALKNLEVVKCIVSDVPMLNIDADQLQRGDLTFIKRLGLKISNPETEKAVALGEEYKTFGRKLADWFDDATDDDSWAFSSTPSSSGSLFGGSSSLGGFGGGFGGFGGGGFGGGGASRGF